MAAARTISFHNEMGLYCISNGRVESVSLMG